MNQGDESVVQDFHECWVQWSPRRAGIVRYLKEIRHEVELYRQFGRRQDTFSTSRLILMAIVFMFAFHSLSRLGERVTQIAFARSEAVAIWSAGSRSPE